MKKVLSIGCVVTLLCVVILFGGTGGKGPGGPSAAGGPGGPSAAGGPGGPALRPVVAAGNVFSVRDRISLRYTGRVVSPASVNLIARVSGEILSVDFHEGGDVQAGQTLYRLDPVRYEAAVKSAEGKVMQCKAEYAYAKADLARNRVLFGRASVSRDVLESAERTEKVRHGELLAAEADLVTAMDDLHHTRITAPAAGRIGVTSFTAGNYVSASSGTLATLLQTDPVRVRFALSTRDMLAVYGSVQGLRDTGRVRLRLADGTDLAEEGSVIIVDNMAGSKTDTLQVYAEFANPQGRLIPGGTVVVTLFRDRENTMVPAVAPTAVLHDPEGAFVYVLKSDQSIEKRRVVLGDMAGEAQKILSGVSPGERIVTDGTQKVTDGVQVECVEETPSAEM